MLTPRRCSLLFLQNNRVGPSKLSLPQCYEVKAVPPLAQRIVQLSDEVLFYIFYNMPGDVMQVAAASVLYVSCLCFALV
jgi:hypothetical protein